MSIKSKNLINKIKRNNPYFEDMITRNVYHSNRIEGYTLSYAETYSIIFNNKNNIQVKATLKDLYGATNLKYAIDYVLRNLDKAVSLEMIKKIGVIINKNIKNVKDYRDDQVYIKGSQHIPPKHYEVKNLLTKLLYIDTKDRQEDLFNYIARFHIEFERIHPFEDGNGRTGRVLILKELLNKGQAPIVIPYELRDKYMNYLEDRNVKMLAELFRKLQEEEIKRMERFNIKI